MKNILKVITVFAVVIIMCVTSVMAEAGDVEISFCVGDETLTINGTPVTVEKPYVVGEGVTLVPVRVITEAFGADVDWDGTTKTVTLTYPDVKVILQIDNPIAEVNGKAEKLLSAPELTDSGFTFVPLRFLSETFGAEVSYDNDTKKITVTKSASAEAGTVEGAVSNKNIGDSYYNWSMENPKDMFMEYRDFDGGVTYFSQDDNNYFNVIVYRLDEEDNIEQRFNNTKTQATRDGYTLVKAEKSVGNPKLKTMHIQAKDKNEFVNMIAVQTDKYMYTLYGLFEAGNEKKDEYIRIMSTFTADFNVDDVYDLSKVKDGFRKFESEDMKISFDVPENFFMTSSEDTENVFTFISSESEDYISDMVVAIYSKESGLSAEEMARKDYEHNKGDINELIATFSEDVTLKEYDRFTAYEYTYNIKYESKGEQYTRDVFFEVGDYVYNVAVSVKLPMKDYDEYVTRIINSVKAELLNFDNVGVLIRDENEATGKVKIKIGQAYMEIPNNYIEEASNGNQKVYTSPFAAISFQELNSPESYADLRKQLKEMEKGLKEDEITIISHTAEKKAGEVAYVSFTTKEVDDNGQVSYTQIFGTVKNKQTYLVIVGYGELGYSESGRREVLSILATLTTK